MKDTEYAKLIEIPICSTNVMVKASKKKKNDAKKEVIEKINNEESVKEEVIAPNINESNNVEVEYKQNKKFINKVKNYFSLSKFKKDKPKTKKTNKAVVYSTESKTKNSKLDVVSVQVVTIFVLLIGIILTNIFWEDSGINNLLKNVFSGKKTEISATYEKFDAKLPSKTNDVTIVAGVMQINGGSIYSPCNGVIENVNKVNDTYNVTIRHSDSFSTVVSGLKYCYQNVNDTVYDTIALGYADDVVNVSMYSNGSLLTAYSLGEENIIWMT